MSWLAVALGGALGACGRYALALHFTSANSKFPLATFIANGLGCFFIGAAFVIISERALLPDTWRHFVIVGLLGALTTYSTFSLETIKLIQKADYKIALIYTSGTLLVCLMSTFLGVVLAKTLTPNPAL